MAEQLRLVDHGQEGAVEEVLIILFNSPVPCSIIPIIVSPGMVVITGLGLRRFTKCTNES